MIDVLEIIILFSFILYVCIGAIMPEWERPALVFLISMILISQSMFKERVKRVFSANLIMIFGIIKLLEEDEEDKEKEESEDDKCSLS